MREAGQTQVCWGPAAWPQDHQEIEASQTLQGPVRHRATRSQHGLHKHFCLASLSLRTSNLEASQASTTIFLLSAARTLLPRRASAELRMKGCVHCSFTRTAHPNSINLTRTAWDFNTNKPRKVRQPPRSSEPEHGCTTSLSPQGRSAPAPRQKQRQFSQHHQLQQWARHTAPAKTEVLASPQDLFLHRYCLKLLYQHRCTTRQMRAMAGEPELLAPKQS